MKLEEIGFYTLSDERAKNLAYSSPIKRAEILLNNKWLLCFFIMIITFGVISGRMNLTRYLKI
jgi:hypothetical protein